jgi:hypothetical protein
MPISLPQKTEEVCSYCDERQDVVHWVAIDLAERRDLRPYLARRARARAALARLRGSRGLPVGNRLAIWARDTGAPWEAPLSL